MCVYFPCVAACWLCLFVRQGGVSEQVLQRFRLQAEPFLFLISDKCTGCYMIDQKSDSYCQTVVLNYVLKSIWTVTSQMRMICLNKGSLMLLGSEWFRSLAQWTWWFKLLFSVSILKKYNCIVSNEKNMYNFFFISVKFNFVIALLDLKIYSIYEHTSRL